MDCIAWIYLNVQYHLVSPCFVYSVILLIEHFKNKSKTEFWLWMLKKICLCVCVKNKIASTNYVLGHNKNRKHQVLQERILKVVVWLHKSLKRLYLWITAISELAEDKGTLTWHIIHLCFTDSCNTTHIFIISSHKSEREQQQQHIDIYVSLV